MKIQNVDFQGSGSTTSNRIRNQCRIFSTFGLARKHGLQESDWVCHPLVTTDQDYIDLADFEQVQRWSKQRPFSVCILRPKHVKSTKKQTKQNVMSLQVDDDNNNKKKQKSATKQDSEEDDEETQLEPSKFLAKPLKVDRTTQAAASSLLSLQQQFQSGQRDSKDQMPTKNKYTNATKGGSNSASFSNNNNKNIQGLKLSRAPAKKPIATKRASSLLTPNTSEESSSLKLSRMPNKKSNPTKRASNLLTPDIKSKQLSLIHI